MATITKGGITTTDGTAGKHCFPAATTSEVCRYLFLAQVTTVDAEYSLDNGVTWRVWRTAFGPIKLPFQSRILASAIMVRPYTNGQTLTVEGYSAPEMVLT